MSTTTDHLIQAADGVSLAVAGESVEGADVTSMPVSANGLSSELLEELAVLAAEKVRLGGLRLMGEGGLPELGQAKGCAVSFSCFGQQGGSRLSLPFLPGVPAGDGPPGGNRQPAEELEAVAHESQPRGDVCVHARPSA